MGLTKSQADELAALVFDDGFDELREGFRIRLGSDRIHLIALSTALANAVGVPTQTLNDLRNRAHRLSGTAAIFELVPVAKAARRLELAIDSVATAKVDCRGVCMGAAVDALVHLIGVLGQQMSSPRTSAARPSLRPAKRTLHG